MVTMGLIKYKDVLSVGYMNSHCGDKTILRLSYLHNGISYNKRDSSYLRRHRAHNDVSVMEILFAHQTGI